MLRRLTAILVVSAALLGLAQPLMACAADMATSDCCGGGAGSDCALPGTMPACTVNGGACCITSPVAPATSLAAPARSMDQLLRDGGSLVPAPPGPPGGSGGRVASACSHVPAPDASRGAYATHTYLHTARLRL